MNLPFSRKQEMEADHIGLMLMASACYDPREAPRVWRGFTAFFSGDTMTELEMSLDFHSTHPSNKKRERMLDALVPEALALQRRSSWCFQLKERVAELLRHGDRNADRQHQEETTFIQRLHRFRFDQEQEREAPTRRPTVGTIHELENKEVLRVLGEAHADPEAEPEEAA
jgi:predicted Zn-dependent protease